jgi:hypothetical protein
MEWLFDIVDYDPKNKKAHRNGIKKPKSHGRHLSLKGVCDLLKTLAP